MADLFHLIFQTDEGNYKHFNNWDDEEEIARALSKQPDVVTLDDPGGPRTNTTSPARIIKDARRLTTEMFEIWTRLRNIVRRHGIVV